MAKLARLVALGAFCVIFLPPHAQGQALATIAGTVRDTSGAVLPGVTVEASSPALIEKSRSAVTDGAGQYRIVDLRPGTYVVAFSLQGFSTIKRDGLELTGSFTATINAEMKLGAVEETITVSGAAPTVDVQSTARQRVIDSAVMDAVPSGRNQFNLGVLVPGVTVSANGSLSGNAAQDVGGSRGPDTTALVIHGGKTADQRVTQNGVPLSSMVGGGWGSGSITNPVATQEITVDTASVSAEMPTGGVRINLVPREGGNSFRGTVFGAVTTEDMQSNNFDEDLRARGLRSVGRIQKVFDITPGFGGPLSRDRLWFFVAFRHQGANNYVPSMFYNKNANDPTKWTYEPDTSRPAINYGDWKGGQARLTWQAAAKHKVGLTWDDQQFCRCPDAITALVAPEAGFDRKFPVERTVQADWTSPVTSRLLLEVAGVHKFDRWGNQDLQVRDQVDSRMISVTEQGGTIPGLTYRSAAFGALQQYSNNYDRTDHWRAALSYVTGTHAIKVGYNDANGINRSRNYSLQPVSYQLLNGRPNQINLRILPETQGVNVDHDLGLFAQDKWTTGRMTITYGMRYDHFVSSFPEQTLEPSPLAPDRNRVLPAQDNLSWSDITPKTGFVYDVSGNGKTAVKVSLNKYLAGYGTAGLAASPNPIARTVRAAFRQWTDDGDFIPQCDLTLPAANGECGAISDPNFGKDIAGTSFNPDLLKGWGKRDFNWEVSAGVQREVIPRVSAEVSYFRRWYGNFQVTDNRAVGPDDYDTFSLTVPTDSRLPDGGGYVVDGLKAIKPTSFGRPSDNFVTLARLLPGSPKQREHFDGVDFGVNARLTSGTIVQAGGSTGKTMTDNCDVAAVLPEGLQGQALLTLGNGGATWTPLEYCHQESPFLTQWKALATYTVPKVDIKISGTFQSLPGPHIPANYVVTNAIILSSSTLGRPLVGASNMTVNVAQPGSVYGERLNQTDLRFGKLFNLGGSRRTVVNLDLYNAFNANPVVALNSTYGSAWQTPTAVLQARFVKISAQFDF